MTETEDLSRLLESLSRRVEDEITSSKGLGITAPNEDIEVVKRSSGMLQEQFLDFVLREIFYKKALNSLEAFLKDINIVGTAIRPTGAHQHYISREDLVSLWMTFVMSLNRLVHVFISGVKVHYDFTDAKLNEATTNVLRSHPIILHVIDMTKRVAKFAYKIFTLLREDPNSEWNKAFRSIINSFAYICGKEAIDLTETMEYAIANGLREVINTIVIRHCVDLTAPDIMATIQAEVEAMTAFIVKLNASFMPLQKKIKVYSMRAFIVHVTDRYYELVIDCYPESKPTVIQLSMAMDAVQWGNRAEIIDGFVEKIKQKLLKTGINTRQLLKAYASCVQCLTVFDPSSVLVRRVCGVIKDYITARPDAMKTIIKFITSERPGDQLTNYDNPIFSENQLHEMNDEYVLAFEETSRGDWYTWEPDPRDTLPLESKLYRSSMDVFGMLVQIYGTRETFVKEYREALAKRLTSPACRHIYDEEQSYVDMMKRRFYGAELTSCEVMLQDIVDSTEMCTDIQPLEARVLSGEYWPHPDDRNIPLPDFVQKFRTKFEEFYKLHKSCRRLEWYDTYGTSVKLEIGLGTANVEMEVTMLQFVVIQLFLEKDSWQLEALKFRFKLSNVVLHDILGWWIQKGILRVEGDTYRLNDDPAAWKNLSEQCQKDHSKHEHEAFDVDNESGDEIEFDDDEEGCNPRIDQLESFWGYIQGMLHMAAVRPVAVVGTPAFTAERLCQIFKLVAGAEPAATLSEVQAFMNRKIRQDLVYLENGVYKATEKMVRLVAERKA